MASLLPITLLIVAALYLRGFLKIRRTRPAVFTALRAASFFIALLVLYLALFPPMDELADELLSAHMVEHLMLMSFVPPLLLLGLPVVPLLRGLPRCVLKVLGPFLRSRGLRAVVHGLTLPATAWMLMNAVFLLWHVPAAYDFALEHEGVHALEHLCFLATSILFWAVVIRPWPMQQRPDSWGVLLYLLSADLVNTALSAFLAFCDRPVYLYYVTHPNSFHLSTAQDQVVGAVVMWVVGSTVFLVPATVITMRLLAPRLLEAGTGPTMAG